MKVVGLAPDDEGIGDREDVQEANKDCSEFRDFVNLAEEDYDQSAESAQRVIGDYNGTEVKNLTEDDEHVRVEVDKHLKQEIIYEEIFENVENADGGITIHNIYDDAPGHIELSEESHPDHERNSNSPKKLDDNSSENKSESETHEREDGDNVETVQEETTENGDNNTRAARNVNVGSFSGQNGETIREESVEIGAHSFAEAKIEVSSPSATRRRKRKKKEGGYIPRCPICRQRILNEEKQSHISSHAVGGIFHCDSCDFSTKFSKKLRPHVQFHHEGVKYSCELCDYQGFRLRDLVIHKKTEHSDEEHVCCECGFKVKTKHALSIHTYHKHTKEPSFFKCEYEGCDFTSSKKDKLTEHMRGKHKRIKYTCPVCDISILRREKDDHLQLHTDKDKFCCDVCDFKSSFLSYVKNHKIITHSGIMYNCTVEDCQYKTARKSSLRLHNENLHLNMKYPCEVCGHFATTTSNLAQHKRKKHKEIVEN